MTDRLVAVPGTYTIEDADDHAVSSTDAPRARDRHGSHRGLRRYSIDRR